MGRGAMGDIFNDSRNDKEAAARPTMREIDIVKAPELPFGVSVARIKQQIYVLDVRPDTPAWRAGLQKYDRLDQLDGELITMKVTIQVGFVPTP